MAPLIVANWKMRLSDGESVELARAVTSLRAPGVDVVLCPSFTALPAVASVVAGGKVALGAQDCSWEERASLTGEVSPVDLAALGCQYVIVGHSERREHLGESDTMVASKFSAALAAGLMPILCVGETELQREAGVRDAVIAGQLTVALAGVEADAVFCVAYEPLWAIGTGVPALPEDAAAAVALIVAHTNGRARVLYGGSVDAENLASFLAVKGIAGALVATASQSATALRKIIRAAAGR